MEEIVKDFTFKLTEEQLTDGIIITKEELEQFRQICQSFKNLMNIAKDEICLEVDKWKIYYNIYSTKIEIHHDNRLIYEYYFRENTVYVCNNKVEQSCFEKFEDIFFGNLVH